jgi:hypothetical protein
MQISGVRCTPELHKHPAQTKTLAVNAQITISAFMLNRMSLS